MSYIKYFYHVASTLSFSEASKQLFISQSAVSQSIKALEKKAGSDLIHPKHQESTSYYRRRDSSAPYRTGDQPDQAWGKASFDVGVRGGQLHIGASDTICRYFLVPYLERFHREFPGAHIKVTNATSIAA